MRCVALIFPHQLFESHPVLRKNPERVFLVENSLFFGDAQYPMRFHTRKIAYHKDTMTQYAAALKQSGVEVEYIDYQGGPCELDDVLQRLSEDRIAKIYCADLCDYALEKRLVNAALLHKIELTLLPTPAFLNTSQQNREWRSTKKRWRMVDFYQWQRVRLDILMEGDVPEGGQWSYDGDNRRKLPLKQLPLLPSLPSTEYPTTHDDAKLWLEQFLHTRFELFGPYEDAIESGQNWLYHSVLTPMLNVGLLTPGYVVRQALQHAKIHKVPLNSVEGFVRQVIGWREFMRATYEDHGVTMRNGNHWQHTRPMPEAFYNAATGIDPVDDCIQRVKEHAYCHHIERLMVLGGFMFLCEIHPDDIYKWFMELFIDSYDWVMVTNVYAMSQHADGGLITTKPYFSGSNYVIKMSHYKKGQWSEIWDALFWRWLIKNKVKLAGNHRWSMMCKNAEKMDDLKKQQYVNTAEGFLSKLA